MMFPLNVFSLRGDDKEWRFGLRVLLAEGFGQSGTAQRDESELERNLPIIAVQFSG